MGVWMKARDVDLKEEMVNYMLKVIWNS